MVSGALDSTPNSSSGFHGTISPIHDKGELTRGTAAAKCTSVSNLTWWNRCKRSSKSKGQPKFLLINK